MTSVKREGIRAVLKEAMLTLWDLLKPAKPITVVGPPHRPAAVRMKPGVKPQKLTLAAKPARPAPSVAGAQARYDAVTQQMLSKYGVRVRKWRTGMSGVAWCVTYRDGTVARLIESPRPKGPMSAAVFLHEIGHHAIGFNTYKPRCLEEYHAWVFSIRSMEEHGLNVTGAVKDRMYRSLHYAVAKAARRGIKRLPPELEAYVKPPPPRRRSRSE